MKKEGDRVHAALSSNLEKISEGGGQDSREKANDLIIAEGNVCEITFRVSALRRIGRALRASRRGDVCTDFISVDLPCAYRRV